MIYYCCFIVLWHKNWSFIKVKREDYVGDTTSEILKDSIGSFTDDGSSWITERIPIKHKSPKDIG